MSECEAHNPPETAWFAAYGRLLQGLVAALMVILFVEVLVAVVFRMIGHSLIWYDEVASILLAWLTFYGSALASHKRAHIGCPEVVEQLPPHWRRRMDVLTQCLVIAFFAALGWVGFAIMPILAGDAMTSLPQIHMNWVQSTVPISAALILIVEVRQLWLLLSPAPLRATAGG